MSVSNGRYPEENLLSHRAHTLKFLTDAAKLHSNSHLKAVHENISLNPQHLRHYRLFILWIKKYFVIFLNLLSSDVMNKRMYFH